MEELRHIGEVIGSLNSLMLFKDEIQVNQRQCCLLFDMFDSAYKLITEEIKQSLKFEERQTKWKVLEQPLKELYKVFKEGEIYIRQCLETRDFLAKAIVLYQNRDCVEFHIHNLLCSITILIEAVENAAEISGSDQDEIQKKRYVCSMKYKNELKNSNLFKWRFGKQYLVTQDFCNRISSAWEEDRWILLKKIQEDSAGSTKQERRLKDLILNLDKILPAKILTGSKDFQIRRRLGTSNQYKEIQWLGECFALRHFFGNIEPLIDDITQELKLSHPNIMHVFCGFTDEEKKECFLVMELMNRDLSTYIKEICYAKKKVCFSLLVSVDLMLQIARGMEYLHSKKIYHGDLNPFNVLVKPRSSLTTTDGYLLAKVSGFGLSSTIIPSLKIQNNGSFNFIWYPPEVLAEQEQGGIIDELKYTEKSDVYSFGMICFQLLTGKVPFEDGHLQGDQMGRNIRTGERPLFPHGSPKYLTSLTKKCWHNDPNQRPSFSSICRILRNIKRFLIMNGSDQSSVDYSEMENGDLGLSSVSEIPFQMFACRVTEREKMNGTGSCGSSKESMESSSDNTSACEDDDMFVPLPIDKKPLISAESLTKKLISRKSLDGRSVSKLMAGTISFPRIRIHYL
jgi:serine/threonine protein kinase